MFLLKPKMIFLLAVVSGLLAFYGFRRYIEQREEEVKMPLATRPVVVSAENLTLGTTLNWDNLQVTEWPENIVPKGSFQEKKDLDGRVIKTAVTAGEAILASKLALKGSSGGVSSLIPKGMRAMSIAVNVVSGVSGFILPNTWVDILMTIKPSSSDKTKTLTKTILEYVQVLAVDQIYKENDDDPITVKSVTLLVAPEDAERLALAGNEGKLQLTLRNTADSELYKTDGVLLSQLLKVQSRRPIRRRVSRPQPPPKAEKTPSVRVVEVIRANVRSEVSFEEEGSNSEDKEVKTASKQ